MALAFMSKNLPIMGTIKNNGTKTKAATMLNSVMACPLCPQRLPETDMKDLRWLILGII